MIKQVVVLSLLALGIVAGCKKETANTPGVPNVAVNFSVNLDTAFLLNADGWEYARGGYDGIVIVSEGTDSYLAFDRGCPYDCESNPKAIITVQAGAYTAICPVCGTTYSLSKGTTTKGPGNVGLKQYLVSYNGIYITITN